MKNFFAAFNFLTIFTLPGARTADGEGLKKSLIYFPFVGIILGIFASLSAVCWQFVFPPILVAVLLTFTLIALSGGLHMDGLADTADGFFSARPRERTLEIMRDSCIGAMGTLAIILVICLKVSAIVSMPEERVWQVVFFMPVAGRCILVIMTTCFGYARVEGGLATPFFNGKKLLPLSVSVLVLSTLGTVFFGILLSLVCVTSILLIGAVFGLYCNKKIGGITGDTLGCSCEIAETAVALLFACNLIPV